MSVNLFDEIYTPDIQAYDERIYMVERGIPLGRTAVEVYGKYPDATALHLAIKKLSTVLELNREILIGLYAGSRIERNIQAGNSDPADVDPYNITETFEVKQLEAARRLGQNERAQYPGADPVAISIGELILAERSDSSFFQSVDFLGHILGTAIYEGAPDRPSQGVLI